MLEAKILKTLARVLLCSSLLQCTPSYSIIPKEKSEFCFEIEKQTTSFSFCTTNLTNNDLEHIADVKAFAQKNFGLLKTSNYISYTENPRTLYSLIVTSSTSSPLATATYRYYEYDGNHCFNEILPLKIDYEVDHLNDEKECYQRKGYDVYLREVTGIGDGSNISPAFIRQSFVRRTELICHEDQHQTDQIKGNGDMDHALQESRASWVGSACTMEYFRQQGDFQSHEQAVKEYLASYQFAQRLNTAVVALDKLQQERACYTDAKFKQRENEIMNRVVPEATKSLLMSHHPYTKYFPILAEIYAESNYDHNIMIKVISNTPKKEEQAERYFRNIREGL